MVQDQELMERLKADDSEALEQLILRWKERAEAYAVTILHDPQAAEDAVLEAFARVYAARRAYSTRYAFSTYLYMIVRRICISELRKGKRIPVPWGTEKLPELPADSAETEYLRQWERDDRIRRVAELDETDRKLLLGFSLEGKTTRELAQATGMTDGQVRIRLHRIRKRLRKGENDGR